MTLPDTITPYWSDAEAGLYVVHGDCRDVLPRLEPGSVDLVLTDPPYNSQIDYGNAEGDNRDDYWDWLMGILDACCALAETVIVKHSAYKMSEFLSRRPSRVLIWCKPFSKGFPMNGFASHFEPLYVVQGTASTWSKDYYIGQGYGKTLGETGIHPARTPIDVLMWLVGVTSGNILEPFLGSGTTLVAAKMLGRRGIGIEINERYCEIAARRLEATPYPLRFPDPTPAPVQTALDL